MASGLGALASPAMAAAKVPVPGEEAAVKRRMADWYRAFSNPRVDRAYYASFMTDDYLLLENGELLDKAGDIAFLDALPADLQRSNRFDYRRVAISGDRADLVYFLESDMVDSANGARHRRWLESATLRREDGEWRCALLHSTRITPAE